MPLVTTTPAELGLSDAEWDELVETAKENFRQKKVSKRASLYDVFGQGDEQKPEEVYYLTDSNVNRRNSCLAYLVARQELGIWLAPDAQGNYDWRPKEST